VQELDTLQEQDQGSLSQIELLMYEELDSTNDELRRILTLEGTFNNTAKMATLSGGSERLTSGNPTAVIALRQTAGRGRLGRSWASPAGGLYFSVALDVSDALEGTAALSLLVALAIRKTLAGWVLGEPHSQGLPATKHQTISVKWPNDILCSSGKLVGILIELLQLAPGQRTALIGVGINLNRPHKGASDAAAYLSDLGHAPPTLEAGARQALSSILGYYGRWKDEGYCFAHFASEYNQHLLLLGQYAIASNSQGSVLAEGTVQGVDNNGQLLLLSTEGVINKINTGEVTLRQQDNHTAKENVQHDR